MPVDISGKHSYGRDRRPKSQEILEMELTNPAPSPVNEQRHLSCAQVRWAETYKLAFGGQIGRDILR